VKYTRQMLAAVLAVMPALATAQFGGSAGIATQVPFAFNVGDRVVPAGKCIVQSANTATDTILIRNYDNKLSVFSSASVFETRQAPATDELVFHKYGERYFLSSIRLEGTRIAYQVPESKEEAGLRMQNQPVGEETIHASLK
jgi:hypothetical protein